MPNVTASYIRHSVSTITFAGVYYCFNMVIIMTSIFLSTVVVNIYRGGQDNSAPPAWIRMVRETGNTFRQRRNGHFSDDIFKYFFVNGNVWISIKISTTFFSRDPINTIPALLQIMAWRRLGDRLLSEPVMNRLPTHICVTWPRWVKTLNTLIHDRDTVGRRH